MWYLGGSGEIVLIVFARGLLLDAEGEPSVLVLICWNNPVTLKEVVAVEASFDLTWDGDTLADTSRTGQGFG